MGNQYFENNEDLVSDQKTIKVYVCNKDMKFYTDNGVFSKKGLDFGSRELLENLDFDSDYKRVLDLGCGYGPIGITISKILGSTSVDMVDINERAIELCKKNTLLNGISKTNVFKSDSGSDVSHDYDLVVTNPPFRAGKKVVNGFIENSYNFLKDNGKFYMVVQKKQGAPSYARTIESTFNNCEVVSKNKGYFVLKAVKNA